MYKQYKFQDKYGGKNYGCYPVKTDSKKFKDKLENSDKWILTDVENYIDERNDNQCDIDRGSDFCYKHYASSKVIFVQVRKTRSGKTVNWLFNCNFNEDIKF